jgi:tyrosine-protein phosphatase YwqE
VKAAYEEVKEALRKENIDIELYLAAEYKTDDIFKARLEANDLLTIEDKYVLIELPFFQPPLDWEDQLFSLQMAGYTPVLAHTERFVYLAEVKGKLSELKERGVEPQLNLSSLVGKYGPQIKKIALQWIEKEAYLWVGTDAHRPNDLKVLEAELRNNWPKQLQSQQYQRNVTL